MKVAGVDLQSTFNLQVQEIANFSLHGVGLLLFYLLTIVFVVYFFTEFYLDTYEVSMKERWVMIAIGLTFGLLDTWLGDARIYFPVWGLLAYLLVVDLKYQELPDGVNLTIAVLALPVVIQAFQHPGYLNSTLLTGVFLFIFFLLISLVGALGGGDIKMMGAIGLYFPFVEVSQLLVFGFGVGVIHAITVLFKKDTNLKSKFAFGPGLIIGALITSLL